MIKTKSYAAHSATSPLVPFEIQRRDLNPEDVQIDILYCGVCHSDLHTARNEWKNTLYPSVPGHEIVGRVAAVGKKVQGFKPGELVGVGSDYWAAENFRVSHKAPLNYSLEDLEADRQSAKDLLKP
jgi:uncharacterized zinc-type alcohol dehydrogenase-like protein